MFCLVIRVIDVQINRGDVLPLITDGLNSCKSSLNMDRVLLGPGVKIT